MNQRAADLSAAAPRPSTDANTASKRHPRPVTPPSRQPSRAQTVLQRLADSRAQILAVIAVVAIAAGFLLHALGAPEAGHQVWRAAVALLLSLIHI